VTEDQRELLEQAQESLEAAKYLVAGGFAAAAASRAYYAMFYVAQAFLEGDEMAFSKHSGVIAAFGQYLRMSVGYRKVSTVFSLMLRSCESQAITDVGER
jgi:uncharacterized protein (UPF0332 family)